MKPKNSKERQVAFFKFLAFFLATVLTVVIAVYFNYKVPNEENDLLRGKIEEDKHIKEFQNDFFKEMKIIKNKIDSLDIPGEDTKFDYELIASKLVKLQGKIEKKDTTFRYEMYTDIVSTFDELQKSKEKLRDVNKEIKVKEEYKRALEKCETKKELLQRELLIRSSN